jgi:diguanylate cyclase (GGDEF)-like protein
VFSPNQLTKECSFALVQLCAAGGGDAPFIQGVESLAREHGNDIYREVLMLLVGKHFDAELAARYWRAAIDHCRTIFLPSYADRGFRPALLDYLYNVAGELSDPRIIEADYLQNITRSSVTDGLTGLYNQTYFKKILKTTIAKQRRSADQSFALVLLDLDHFKQYNDRCGHLSGDEALRLCAGVINGALRDGDMAVRYGGEEFALLLPNLDRRAAYGVAERIRGEIEKFPFPHEEKLDNGCLTISGGIAVFPENGETVEEMIEYADKELYKAKEVRNRIHCHNSDRRSSSRKQVRTLVEYASFDGALYRPALSIDISEKGMGIGCESPLLEGMTLSVRLTRPYWPMNMHISAKVRQVRRQNELVYVGLEFDDSLTSIDELLSHFKQYPAYAQL